MWGEGGTQGACSPPNPICLDPGSETHWLASSGRVCALCRRTRLLARVGHAGVNRCAALCKPGLGLVTCPGVSASCQSPASSSHHQTLVYSSHPYEI